MDRRDFIKTSLGGALLATGGVGAYWWSKRAFGQKPWVVGGGRFVRDGSTQNLLAMVDLERGNARYIELDFLPHGLIFDPRQRDRAWAFEKIGPGACELSLKTGEVIRSISPLAGHQFYGHGAFSPDGKIFYATETRTQDQAGVIVLRDGQTSQVIGEFPSYGENPHECHLVDQGRTLLVTNGGGDLSTDQRASVSSIDVATQKLIRKWVIPVDRWNAGHLAPFGEGDQRRVVVVSAPRRGLSDQNLGGISVLGGDGQLRAVQGPEEILQKLQGEALSVCIHPTRGIFGVTHPLGNLVTFWGLADQKFRSAISIERPRGLTLTADQSAFLLSYGKNASLAEIDLQRLVVSERAHYPNTGLAGSHLFHWHG